MTEKMTTELRTRDGYRFHVRPVTGNDEPRLTDFFHHVGPEDLRFRFLSAVREGSHDWLVGMMNPGERTDSLLAENDRGEVVAAAMLAGDPAGERGEVAISIRADEKGRGIGWTLLEHLVGIARARGYASIESIEDRQNRAAITIEQEMGFDTQPVEGDSTLILVRKRLR